MGWKDRQHEKKKQIWISVFMAALMIFSAFGIYLGSVSGPEQQFEYKGHEFEFEQGRYVTLINGAEVPFYNLPYDLETVNLSIEAVNLLRNAWVLQVVFDPEQPNLEYVELTRFDWGKYWGRQIMSGVVKESDLYSGLPLLSCANGTLNGPVIYLNVSQEFSSKAYDNCLVLNGIGVDFLRWRDRVLYSHLGILDQG